MSTRLFLGRLLLLVSSVVSIVVAVKYWQNAQQALRCQPFNAAMPFTPLNKGAAACFQLGLGAARQNNLPAAILYYNRALELQQTWKPEDLWAIYVHRGTSQATLGEYLKAIPDYDRAIAIARQIPNNPLQAKLAETYVNRGIARSVSGDPEGAIADYTEAIALRPDYADAYIYRGNVRYGFRRFRAAIPDYDEALKLRPNDGVIYFNRGNARGKIRDYEGAIADYNKAIELVPDFATAYHNRGLSYLDLNSPESAISNFQIAARLSQQQGSEENYQLAMDLLQQLQ